MYDSDQDFLELVLKIDYTAKNDDKFKFSFQVEIKGMFDKINKRSLTSRPWTDLYEQVSSKVVDYAENLFPHLDYENFSIISSNKKEDE